MHNSNVGIANVTAREILNLLVQAPGLQMSGDALRVIVITGEGHLASGLIAAPDKTEARAWPAPRTTRWIIFSD
jgi:hypothetical protein